MPPAGNIPHRRFVPEHLRVAKVTGGMIPARSVFYFRSAASVIETLERALKRRAVHIVADPEHAGTLMQLGDEDLVHSGLLHGSEIDNKDRVICAGIPRSHAREGPLRNDLVGCSIPDLIGSSAVIGNDGEFPVRGTVTELICDNGGGIAARLS